MPTLNSFPITTTTIAGLTGFTGSVDGTQDTIPYYQALTTSTLAITRNQFLNITSQPLGLTDTQSPTNKTFDNTNTVTLKDTLFTLQDDGDTTKQAKFQLSGLSTATTRTYTLPNVTDTLVSLTATQTLTNKTLTAPAISGGTMDNTTVTVDSISGHTSPTIVSVAGLSISNGVLNTNNSVVTSNITDLAVTNAKLAANTAWSSWVPVWTNLSVGNGTINAKYQQIGKTVTARINLTLGSSSTVSGNISFTSPIAAATDYAASQHVVGTFYAEDFGVAAYPGLVEFRSSATVCTLEVFGAAGTYVNMVATTGSIPFSWGNTDTISIVFTYEAA